MLNFRVDITDWIDSILLETMFETLIHHKFFVDSTYIVDFNLTAVIRLITIVAHNSGIGYIVIVNVTGVFFTRLT